MLQIFLKKEGEGVVTGVLWLAAVAIATGLIGYAMWGTDGISGAATSSKEATNSSMTTLTTGLNALTP